MNDQTKSEMPQQPVDKNDYQFLSASEKYTIVVDRMKHEHELSNARMTWLLTFQGFLFTAIAVYENGKQHFLPLGFFQRVVPLIGIVSALAVFLGIIASRMARANLKWFWRNSGVIGFPELSPSKGGGVLGAFPSLVVPAILVVAWGFLFFSPAGNPLLVTPQIVIPSATVQMPAQVSGTNLSAP